MFEILFVLVVIGCGISSYALGRKTGIVATVGYLIEEQIIEVDDSGEINQEGSKVTFVKSIDTKTTGRDRDSQS